MATLDKVPDGSKVVIDGSKSISIHPDVREIIKDFETHAKFANIDLVVKGMKEGVQPNPVSDFQETVNK